MAVEARHLNLFPPPPQQQQLLPPVMMRPFDADHCLPRTNPYNDNTLQMGMGMGYGLPFPLPLSGTTTVDNSAIYNYNNNTVPSSTAPLKSDSGLTTYNLPNTPILSRKRSRLPYSYYPRENNNNDNNNGSGFSFLGEDISLQIQQQQLDTDRLISHHMGKVRIEIEERRKQQARRILQVVEERLAKRLRSKEEEIDKIARMNWALEERIKSLSVENHIWRDLAQTNEATANALRTNLEQVLLSHVKDDGAAIAAGFNGNRTADFNAANGPIADDAESCCDSTGEAVPPECNSRGMDDRRMCRSCRTEEARVLLLPCRHLCLCAACGSSLHTCPVCNSAKTASVHVNLSS